MTESPESSSGMSSSSGSDNEIQYSNTVKEVKECRICYKTVDENEIKSGQVIHPCNCQGIYAFAHKLCMNARLERNGHLSCDICRFPYVMQRHSKSVFDWMATYPNKEEFVELLIRTINLINITIIAWIAINYSQKRPNKWWVKLLALFSTVRSFVLIKVWYELMCKYRQDFHLWKTKNFRVIVEKNPKYKAKEGYIKSRSTARVSGAFDSPKMSPKMSPKK